MGLLVRSPAEFWLTHAALTAAVAGIAFLIRGVVARWATPRGRYVGWCVLAAVVACSLAGGWWNTYG